MQVRVFPVTKLKKILAEPWVDPKRRPFVSGTSAYIPVKYGESYDCDLPERERKGRGFQRLGDRIILHGTYPTPEEMDELINEFHPRGILYLSSHEGITRRPVIELLYGESGDVIHRESGIIYQLNPEKVMFSQGNREEKGRIASCIHSGETICDMFAGIGYFTLPMARAGGHVTACEINPVAYSYLSTNIAHNTLQEQVKPLLGDCGNLITGLFDRIHMGHFDAISFLAIALRHIKSGGIIHLHTIDEKENEIREILSSEDKSARLTVTRVKKIGPRQWHLVYDLEVT